MMPTGMWNAMRGLQAVAATAANLDLPRLAKSNPKLIRRLKDYSFPAIANAAGGLLTLPENQPATFRLESLVALAAAYAQGEKQPTAANLRDWLNDILLRDPIGQLEDPVEDVFVSNVPSWDGNARLFDGLWSDNDTGVEAAVWSTMKLKDRPWAASALDSCMALLTLSEEIARRAGADRYTMSAGAPKRALRITDAVIDQAGTHVKFTTEELRALDLPARRLKPFMLLDDVRAKIAREAIGNSTIERKPLVWDGANVILSIPTAIGSAIRRFVLEQAHAAGDLAEVEGIIRDVQFSEIHEFGLTGLRVDTVRGAEIFGDRNYDLVAKFDKGAYLHLIYVGENLTDVLEQGLRSLHNVGGAVVARATAIAEEMSAQPDYRRGLTLVVNGGVGRGLAVAFNDAPPASWHRIVIDYADLARLAWEHGFDALRIWKAVEQEARLPEHGYQLRNVNGFINLYAYLSSREMTMVPDSASPGGMLLASDHVASTRSFLRSTLDNHVVMSPERDRWLEVRRSATAVFFNEVVNLPLFVSPKDIAEKRWSACVETEARVWWIAIDRKAATPTGRSIEYQVWDMARNWLLRVAPILETRLPTLPAGPVSFVLEISGADVLDSAKAFGTTEFGEPAVKVEDGNVVITCDAEQLAAFARAENVGERQVIAALAMGAGLLAADPIPPGESEYLALSIAGSTEARFFHMIPPRSPSTLVYSAATDLGRPRLLQDEDVAWGRLGLAHLAGWSGKPGPLSVNDAPSVLNAAVDAIWERLRKMLSRLDRDSLVMMALANHDAIAWDRINWSQTASALLALYDDSDDVISAANRLEAGRGVAGLGSRVIAEMGVCACPETGGVPASRTDFDALLADVAILIECANQADAIHWKLAASMPSVNPNQSLGFDNSFLETQQRPYVEAHGEIAFRDAAAGYAETFVPSGKPKGLALDTRFLSAVEAEYGIGLEALARFTIDLSQAAAAQGTTILRLQRSEVIKRLTGDPADCPAKEPERAFDSLTLMPRAQWDEPKPTGAKKRDWYPWRFSRRLSLLQRPLVQIGTGDDPLVFVLPTLLDNFVQRLFMAEAGSLPMDLYSSPAMRSWIGTAVNREGHEFNALVANRLVGLGWKTRPDVNLTELGGTKGLGDVDVLAWHPASGVVMAIECKRLQVARSIGEIGERLAEYAEVAAAGKPRTPIQKHLDRLAFLTQHPAGLAKVTGIPVTGIKLKSALVTNHLVPMQFSKRAGALVDVIADYPSLDRLLKAPQPEK